MSCVALKCKLICVDSGLSVLCSNNNVCFISSNDKLDTVFRLFLSKCGNWLPVKG